jgi:hypothetical protein
MSAPRGLTTTAIPYNDLNFECEFDFIDHVLAIRTSSGASKTLKLAPKSVAAFHAEFMAALAALGIEVHIWTMPVEIPTRSTSRRTRCMQLTTLLPSPASGGR